MSGQAHFSTNNNGQNEPDTCYVIEDIISDTDAPSFNFSLYFLVALVAIRLITVMIDYKQLQEYLKVTIDPYLVDFFE